MIIRALDENGDWTFGKGKSNYLRDADAVALNVKTRIASFLNDCFFDLDMGVDWWGLTGSKNKEEIILQVKTIILQSFGVTELLSFDTVYNTEDRSLTMTYEINTIFSQKRLGVEVVRYA